MGTSSTLTSVLSALGGSNGIDVTSEVNAILYADRAPERGWQAQQATLASQTSALNQLNTEASTLSDSLNTLGQISGVLTAVTATSSNSNVVTATAADGTKPSNHTISVQSLATAGSYYSAAESSSSAALPSGSSFSITVGSTTTQISVGTDSGDSGDTLDAIAASINSQSLGVTANVITDSSGARLALTSTSTGAANDISITSGSGLAFTRSGTGTDAALTVDGVSITSASNTVTGAISGVSLNLAGVSPIASTASDGTPTYTTTQLALAPDTTSITSAVNSFVSAYNTLISDVNTQVGYNKTTNTAGVLQSDSAASGLQSALLAATNYGSGSGAYQTLSSLGITTNSDGTLSLNTTTLANAVQTNSTAVTSFFQGSALNGFADSLTSSLNTYTDPSEGAFTVDLQSISNENSDLTNQTTQLETYLSAQQTILTTKYNNADIAIQQLPQEIKQIQALLNPNSSNSSS
jgi:flagellar hook-associated protein 2